MFRPFAAGLLAAGLVAALPGLAQDPKPKEKEPAKKADPKPKAPKPPRIAINDPAQLKDDADFLVQGEYVGKLTGPDGKDSGYGAQVYANGGGKFTLKLYAGGLPGAGWDGKPPAAGTLIREGGSAASPATGTGVKGAVADGKLTVDDGAGVKGALTKFVRWSPTLGAKPPAGAVVLFAGPGDEKNWKGGKVVELSDGKFLWNGTTTNQPFGAFTAHLEFRTPWMPNSTGQQRGNSGFYIQNRYEVQVLDSFGLEGKNNECGGIYTQYKPAVNMCLPPLTWQTYDVEFTPAVFGEGGKKTAPARITVVHNGVRIHDNVELKGPTGGGQEENAKPGPFQFQNHGDPVVFNNVWVVEKK